MQIPEEEVRQSEQLLVDGIMEMHNLATYQHFAAKPKNGGFDHDSSKAKWEELYAAAGAITDLLGPTPKLARRVAVRVADRITLRDLSERAKTVRSKSCGVEVSLVADVYVFACAVGKVWEAIRGHTPFLRRRGIQGGLGAKLRGLGGAHQRTRKQTWAPCKTCLVKDCDVLGRVGQEGIR